MTFMRFLLVIFIMSSVLTCAGMRNPSDEVVFDNETKPWASDSEKAQGMVLAERSEVIDGMPVPHNLTDEYVKKQKLANTPKIKMLFTRTDNVLNIDINVQGTAWRYTSVLANDGVTYSLMLNNTDAILEGVDYIRPVEKVDIDKYPKGYKLVFHLASEHTMLTSTTENGLKISLTAIKPDMEMLSLNKFGGWAQPVRMATEFTGVKHQGAKTDVSLNGSPLYDTGKIGGRYYIDIIGVDIIPGTIRHAGLFDTIQQIGKTRLIFNKPVSLCPDNHGFTLGESCKGYNGIYRLDSFRNNDAESFSVVLTGKPKMTVKEQKGLVAFGFENTKAMSQILSRFGGSVYKVEAREKDGRLWLIFLYDGNMKYRQYYSGDKFFVVFYR